MVKKTEEICKARDVLIAYSKEKLKELKSLTYGYSGLGEEISSLEELQELLAFSL